MGDSIVTGTAFSFQVERMDREKGSWLACGRSKENTFLARGLIEGHEYRHEVLIAVTL